MQLQFLLRYDDCLDMRGLHPARGSRAADAHAWSALCAGERGGRRMCVVIRSLRHTQSGVSSGTCIAFAVRQGRLAADMRAGRS